MKKLTRNLAATTSPRTPPRGLPREAQVDTRPVILFALFEKGRPTASLRRAVALSRALDAQLRVLRILPAPTRVNALFPHHNVTDAEQALERRFRVGRATRKWLRSSPGAADDSIEQLAIAHGDFVEQVANRAASLGAALIVVPPRESRPGSTVTSLVSASGVPVLVARPATGNETLLAATDLERSDSPILRKAAELGQRLEAPVVAVHNVSPMGVVVGFDSAWPVLVYPEASLREVRSARLAELTAKLPVGARALLRSESNPVNAILGAAREHAADLVVVGTRRRGWLERLVLGSVAEEVVDRAKRSVLVTPLDGAGLLAGAPRARA